MRQFNCAVSAWMDPSPTRPQGPKSKMGRMRGPCKRMQARTWKYSGAPYTSSAAQEAKYLTK